MTIALRVCSSAVLVLQFQQSEIKSQSPLGFSHHCKRIPLFAPELSFPPPRFCCPLCTLGRAELTVPGVGDVGPLHLGTGQVDPGLTGGALYHRSPSVRLPTVTGDLLVLILQVI